MKRRQFTMIQQLQPIKQQTHRSFQPLSPKKADTKAKMLTQSIIREIQRELQNIQGYTLTLRSLNYLNNYVEYHSLLKQIISARETIVQSPRNDFLVQYTRIHCEDNVSKMFNIFINKDQQLRKNSKRYSHQCLIDYFNLKDFTAEKIQNTIIRRIIQAKRKGIIEYQERKKKKTYCRFQFKENQLRVDNTPKTTTFFEDRLYYQILALKLLLKDSFPKMEQISSTCQEIKDNLQRYLANFKLRQDRKGMKSHRSSMFKRQ